MKIKFGILSLMVIVMSGCATSFPIGSIYTDVSLPMEATGAAGRATKVGTTECKSILSLVATGDCSIEAAKKQGGITTVDHVDWHAENILGVIGNYKVTVYGN